MNWTQMEGKWNDMKGRVKERWGKLTDDDLARVEGKHDRLVGLIQQKYGFGKEKAEHEISEWADSAQSLFEKAKDQVGQQVAQVKENVYGAVEQGRKYVQESNLGDMAKDLRDLVGRHPMPAAIVGLGIGYLIGRLTTPSSRS